MTEFEKNPSSPRVFVFFQIHSGTGGRELEEERDGELKGRDKGDNRVSAPTAVCCPSPLEIYPRPVDVAFNVRPASRA